MAMMAAINKNDFGGRQQVTCYSCHHGAGHPMGVPPVLDSDAARPETRTATAGTSAPTPDEIVNKYVAALGGADAIRKVSSRVMKGSILVGTNETPIDLITKAPNKRISISHMGNGQSITAFDGTTGWLGNTGRPPREMSPAESWAAGLDAEFYLALRIKEIFPQLRPGRPENIGGVECNLLLGVSQGHPPVRLYFDKNTGLLARMVRYADTPVGRMPTQIDYADYRDAGGARIPYRWTLSRPNGRFTIQIADVKTDVPVDDAKFAKPADEAK
jgi:photosynthetic reaction center cytochrome c subunit